MEDIFMIVFEKPGVHNTDEASIIAIKKAAELGCAIIAPTTDGDAGRRLCELAKEQGFTGPIVIVTHSYGSKVKGENALRPENRAAMVADGAIIVTAAHALSGVERGMSTRFSGVYPAEIMANTLRMFSQGIKVAVEIGSMALDAGAAEYGKPHVCMGGTGHGLDTAVIMSPAHASSIFETNIHEVLCLPY
jgi:Uncharacterized conserved protein